MATPSSTSTPTTTKFSSRTHVHRTPRKREARSGEFHAGAAAHDANDHIIYNAKTGALFYDADGTGGIAAVQFAKVSGHHSLNHSDFLVI